jgi:hypothetical protein
VARARESTAENAPVAVTAVVAASDEVVAAGSCATLDGAG